LHKIEKSSDACFHQKILVLDDLHEKWCFFGWTDYKILQRQYRPQEMFSDRETNNQSTISTQQLMATQQMKEYVLSVGQSISKLMRSIGAAHETLDEEIRLTQ
jgi:hypothetical protein